MALKKNKIIQKEVNISTNETVTPTVVYDQYFDMKTMSYRVFNDTTAERWAQEIVAHAMKEDTLTATDYFIENNIYYNEAERLALKYPVIEKALEHAKIVIGRRRERGALKNELNGGIVHSSMAMYDPRWKKLAEWKSGLNKEKDNKGNVTVVIERMPETSIVPVKEYSAKTANSEENKENNDV